MSGVDGPHLAADVDAGAVGEVGVEDRDVGPQLEDLAQGDGRAARLSDDLDGVVGLEEARDAATHHFVVVDEVYADRGVCSVT